MTGEAHLHRGRNRATPPAVDQAPSSLAPTYAPRTGAQTTEAKLARMVHHAAELVTAQTATNRLLRQALVQRAFEPKRP